MIVLVNCYPPIPIRDFDWCCYDNEEEEGTTGYGKTRWEAEMNYYKACMENDEKVMK